MGICLGAFLAGHNPGLGLIPKGDNVVREINQKGAQVDDEKDTTIQTDWTFSTGDKRGKTESRRWLYFQDGAAFRLSPKSSAKVLGRYSKNGDVAAILSPFGKGWVANVGPHPEADETWCKLISNDLSSVSIEEADQTCRRGGRDHKPGRRPKRHWSRSCSSLVECIEVEVGADRVLIRFHP